MHEFFKGIHSRVIYVPFTYKNRRFYPCSSMQIMARSPAARDSVVGINMLAQWLATRDEARTGNVATALEKVRGKVFEKSRPTPTITIFNH